MSKTANELEVEDGGSSVEFLGTRLLMALMQWVSLSVVSSRRCCEATLGLAVKGLNPVVDSRQRPNGLGTCVMVGSCLPEED